MKIANTNKLLKLKLIQTKAYKKFYIYNNFKIEDIEHRLKKSLEIIQKYHINGKKILFITSSSVSKWNDLLKHTKHNIVNKDFLSNKKINDRFNFLHPLKKLNSQTKYNLIVILGKFSNDNFINENYKKKIPIIFVGHSLDIFNNQLSYKVPGDFSFHKKKTREYLFLILIKSVLTKKYVFKK